MSMHDEELHDEDAAEELAMERERREKRPTNTEFVEDLMNYSRYGALVQVLVIEGLRAYTAKVSKLTPADFPDGGFVSATGMIDPAAWIACAAEVNQKIEQHTGATEKKGTAA